MYYEGRVLVHLRAFGRAAAIAALALVLTIGLDRVGQAQQPPSAVDLQYTLGAGDQVRVTVFGEDELSGQFELDGGGAVALPLIGEVNARGLTLRQLEQTIRARLQEGYLVDPQVSVEVMNYRPFYILGEVNSPGSYPYVNGMSVINAVALAGGYTYRARTSRMVIVRAGDPQRREQQATEETPVLPGDIIRIPERFF